MNNIIKSKEDDSMYQYYYVNNDQTRNPGLHHEVHTLKHAAELGITNKSLVGYYSNEKDAVKEAKEHFYDDADGCKVCCPDAHEG